MSHITNTGTGRVPIEGNANTLGCYDPSCALQRRLDVTAPSQRSCWGVAHQPCVCGADRYMMATLATQRASHCLELTNLKQVSTDLEMQPEWIAKVEQSLGTWLVCGPHAFLSQFSPLVQFLQAELGTRCKYNKKTGTAQLSVSHSSSRDAVNLARRVQSLLRDFIDKCVGVIAVPSTAASFLSTPCLFCLLFLLCPCQVRHLPSRWVHECRVLPGVRHWRRTGVRVPSVWRASTGA